MIPSKSNVQSTMTGLETRKFTISVNSKSFRVLLDGLYTDKPQSIVRELWTNAWDSHVAAGIPDQPFHCQLPTLIDPTFSVRDYGTSMDHDTVMNVYTSVFDSLKTDTNHQTGCLGLGSKTPFSYTDAFTVIAFSGSERRVYAATMGEDGTPEMTLLKREASDQPRGFEVNFVVQNAHIQDFLLAARKVALGFDIPPTTNVDLELPEVEFSTEGFRVYAKWSTFRASAYVRQGPVLYPVPNEVMWGVASDYRNLVSDGHFFVFDVPIGTVEFTASREALQLTEDTKATLIVEMTDKLAGLKQTAVEDVKEQPTFMKAFKSFAGWRTFLNLPSMESHGRTLRSDRHTMIPLLTNGPTPTLYRPGGRGLQMITPSNKGELFFDINSLPNLEFVIDNPKIKAPRKRKRYLEYADRKPYCFWLDNPDGKEIARLMRVLDLKREQFMTVDKLPDVDVPDRVSSGPASGLYQVIRGSRGYASCGKIADIDDQQDYWWMPIDKATANGQIRMDRVNPNLGYRFDAQKHLVTWVEMLSLFGHDERPILLMTPRAQKRLNMPESTRLDQVVANTLMKYKTEIIKWLEVPRQDDFGYHRNIGVLMERVKRDHSHTLTKEQVNWLQVHHAILDNMPTIPEFKKVTEGRAAVAREISKRYPMFFYPDPVACREYMDVMDEHLQRVNEQEES